MADKKKVLLDDEWNARIEKAMAEAAKSKATPKKTVKKSTKKKK